VKLYGFADVLLYFFDSPAGADTSRQIGNVRGQIVFAAFDDNRIFFMVCL